MRILMLTNTYLPHVGGVARSVAAFADEYRRRGHEVLIVAPEFPDQPEHEEHVVRVPALQNFNGSDFSVRLPVPGFLVNVLNEFQPQVVHAHHPFLLGDTAQRLSARRNLPLVFTHHTMYERYTHYVPGDSPTLRRFAMELATQYANLCDQVFAPSESIAAILRQRGVRVPIEAIPTGVDVEHFASGDGRRVREEFGIPGDALVVGHLGRLAPEKNLPFLAKAVSAYLVRNPRAHFLVVGSGPSGQTIEDLCKRRGVSNRLHMAGVRKDQALVDAYHAMDIFAFASTSETQGMVLTEAMAAGVPVVAIDAAGAREVVRDYVNGRLLPSPNVKAFADALGWVAQHQQPDQLEQEARKTADEFSMGRCAERALEVYDRLISPTPPAEAIAGDATENSWEAVLRLVEAEYRLWENRAAAVSTAIQGEYLSKLPGLRWLKYFWLRLRRALSRNEWAADLLRLPRSKGTAVEPGLIMIQIDGLPRAEFERAVQRGRMPFLRRLIREESYRVHSMYSGLPSSTPAVQGELLYGIRGAVPAFGFRDHATGKLVRMYDPTAAAKVQRRLGATGQGLLHGGSSYSNVYSGGADEAHFCAVTLGWGDFLRDANPLSFIVFFVLHILSALRVVGLLVVEACLAVIDFFRGLIAGHDLWKELKFIPTRVGICVLLREMIVFGASIDAIRGLPVVYVNFLGYDEQAHRRGPSSRFAHWSLRGIDHAIRRIWGAAHQSRHRDYFVWVFSDHGQEEVIPYEALTGRTIDEVVTEIVGANVRAALASESHVPPTDAFTKPAGYVRTVTETDGMAYRRSQWLGSGALKRPFRKMALEAQQESLPEHEVLVSAVGPLGHVYLGAIAERLPDEVLDRIAHELATQGSVPAVLRATQGTVVVWAGRERWELPRDAAKLLGESHPFLADVAVDLVDLCRHPDSGDLVLCGWRHGLAAVSFPRERGAHAGPSPNETHAFALVPAENSERLEEGYLRPFDLRQLAFDILHPPHRPAHAPPRIRVASVGPSPQVAALTSHEDGDMQPPLSLRVLTYNVHSCIGMDGKLSPRRIARLVARCRPDVVALQEIDVGQARSQRMDQAHLIAHELEMQHHFHDVWDVEEEKYGNAVLSQFPIEIVQASKLPASSRQSAEPRGAMWVRLRVRDFELNLLNTHLGLSAAERQRQVEALLGEEWLGKAGRNQPWIVCGDFNLTPRSPTYRRLATELRDAQVILARHKPRRTWTSSYPLGRVDHVFVSDHFDVVEVEVRRSRLAQVASDHLPLLVEITVRQTAHRSQPTSLGTAGVGE